MTVEKFQFPADPNNTGYSLFPEHLEENPNVFFHGTAASNLPSIFERGFIPAPPLESVSFAKASSVALGYACSKRSSNSPEGCVIAVHYGEINRSGIAVETAVLYDYTRVPPPIIIGYCIVPATYSHV